MFSSLLECYQTETRIITKAGNCGGNELSSDMTSIKVVREDFEKEEEKDYDTI